MLYHGMKSTVEANLGAVVAASAAAAAAAAAAIAAAVKGPAVSHPQRCSLEQCFYSELGFSLNSMECDLDKSPEDRSPDHV